MSNVFLVFLALCFGFTAFGADRGQVVSVSANSLFIPNGFDNNDQTEIVVDGYLPDACHKVVPPRIEFNSVLKIFTVIPQAFRFEGNGLVCGTYQVPYTVSANLGVVDAGHYSVTVDGAGRKDLVVKRSSTSGPDDFLYAPVDQVFVDVNPHDQTVTAHITGRYTNSCMRWVETKVLDQSDTIVLLPVIKFADEDDCHATNISYKGISVKLPWKGPGRYLAHTRSLSGASVNHVFSIDGE